MRIPGGCQEEMATTRQSKAWCEQNNGDFHESHLTTPRLSPECSETQTPLTSSSPSCETQESRDPSASAPTIGSHPSASERLESSPRGDDTNFINNPQDHEERKNTSINGDGGEVYVDHDDNSNVDLNYKDDEKIAIDTICRDGEVYDDEYIYVNQCHSKTDTNEKDAKQDWQEFDDDDDDDENWPYGANFPLVFGLGEADEENRNKSIDVDDHEKSKSSSRKRLKKYRKAFIKVCVDLHHAKDKEQEYKREVDDLNEKVNILNEELDDVKRKQKKRMKDNRSSFTIVQLVQLVVMFQGTHLLIAKNETTMSLHDILALWLGYVIYLSSAYILFVQFRSTKPTSTIADEDDFSDDGALANSESKSGIGAGIEHYSYEEKLASKAKKTIEDDDEKTIITANTSNKSRNIDGSNRSSTIRESARKNKKNNGGFGGLFRRKKSRTFEI